MPILNSGEIAVWETMRGFMDNINRGIFSLLGLLLSSAVLSTNGPAANPPYLLGLGTSYAPPMNRTGMYVLNRNWRYYRVKQFMVVSIYG